MLSMQSKVYSGAFKFRSTHSWETGHIFPGPHIFTLSFSSNFLVCPSPLPPLPHCLKWGARVGEGLALVPLTLFPRNKPKCIFKKRWSPFHAKLRLWGETEETMRWISTCGHAAHPLLWSHRVCPFWLLKWAEWEEDFPSWNLETVPKGLKNALVRAIKTREGSHWGRTLGPGPVRRPECLKAELMAAGLPVTVPGPVDNSGRGKWGTPCSGG